MIMVMARKMRSAPTIDRITRMLIFASLISVFPLDFIIAVTEGLIRQAG